MGALAVEERIGQLSAVSARRYLDPDVEVTGGPGPGPVLPADLLSVSGLGLPLSDQQLTTLAREELASIVEMGLRFEAVLIAGFCLHLSARHDLTDPRAVYALHEIGEETRHSRLFSRVLSQLDATCRSPLDTRMWRRLQKLGESFIIQWPALLDVLVLAGEEIPDLFQRLAADHPDTDPYVKAVSRYHRQEEARHLAFARITVGEHWARAGRFERWLVRWLAPRIIADMFRFTVHPGVYASIGLPTWRTWRRANATPRRRGLRYQACRGVLRALMDAGVFRAGRVPRAWRALCGVDRAGQPVAPAWDDLAAATG